MGSQRRRGRESPALHVLVGDERGRPGAAPGLARWVARVAPSRARGSVGIAMVSDARIRQLNQRFRGIDHVTDVLSFPSGPEPRGPRTASSLRPASSLQPPASAESSVSSVSSVVEIPGDVMENFLGDIVIARGVARRQARAARHSERTEIRVLALHGLLHLLGYDHERDDGLMRRVEGRLRRKGGLPGGLIERA
jgi:probable rRNA maturation factor